MFSEWPLSSHRERQESRLRALAGTFSVVAVVMVAVAVAAMATKAKTAGGKCMVWMPMLV